MALAMCCRRALLKISGSIAATSQNHRATPSASSQPRSFCSVLPNEKEVFYAVDVKPKVAKKKSRGGVKSKKEKPSTEKAAEPPTPPPFPSSIIDQFKAGDRRKAVENENEKLPKRQSIQLPLHEIPSHECTPTRTEIVRDLDRRNRFYKNTKRFIVTNCIECTGKLTSFISPVNASISCVRCGSLDRYENKREALLEKLPEMPVISDYEEIPLEDVDPILYDAVILEERRVVAEKKLMDAVMAASSESIDEVNSARNPDESTIVDQLWKETVTIGELESQASKFAKLQTMHGFEKFLPKKTLAHYNVRGHLNDDGPAFCFPRYRGASDKGDDQPPQLAGIQLVRLSAGGKLTASQNPDKNPSYFTGFFGWHLVKSSTKEIVITTNEKDALAVHDATARIAVALPQGHEVDHSVLPYFEQFEKIYLWFPNTHQEYAVRFAELLGVDRCRRIKCKARPIVLIKKNKPDAILEAFDHLDSVKTKNIFELTELRQSVKNEIVNHKELMAGIAQFKRFPLLNDYLIGFRPGELTTLTGPTGSGKTTFMCENMVDFMSQGVRTLLCSFEMKTEKVLKWMEVQYTGLPLHQQKYQSDVDVWMDKFERTSGKLYVMNVDAYIGKTVKEVADAIRSQVETARIQHIVIDNLQYLMGSTISTSNKPSTFDKFDRQNEFLRQLRLIANDCNAHVTLIVHPRKEAAKLTIQSSSGTANIGQEVDNHLIIQKYSERDGVQRKFLHIVKNRHGQHLVEDDRLEMEFNPETYQFKIVERVRGVDDANDD